jgi:hypothetical protein
VRVEYSKPEDRAIKLPGVVDWLASAAGVGYRKLLPTPLSVPERAMCIEMMREILEECGGMSHSQRMLPSPDFSLRYYTVLHWMTARTPYPAEQAQECLEEPSLVAAICVEILNLLETI